MSTTVRPSEASARPGSGSRRRVIVTRPAEGSDALAAALAGYGIESELVAAISIQPVDDTELRRALATPDAWRWVVVTSPAGANAARAALVAVGGATSKVRWAAVGAATRRAIGDDAAVWEPSTSSGDAIGAELPVEPGEAVLLARGNLAEDELPAVLRRRGAVVTEVTAYRTVEGPPAASVQLLAALGRGAPDAVVFASGSAVRGLLAAAAGASSNVLAIPAICIGRRTAAVAGDAGFRVVAIATSTSAAGIADAAARFFAEGAREA